MKYSAAELLQSFIIQTVIIDLPVDHYSISVLQLL